MRLKRKKTAKPIPHEDIGDPNQKGFALESEEIIVETLPANAKAGDWFMILFIRVTRCSLTT